jgi:hypothetical protein
MATVIYFETLVTRGWNFFEMKRIECLLFALHSVLLGNDFIDVVVEDSVHALWVIVAGYFFNQIFQLELNLSI